MNCILFVAGIVFMVAGSERIQPEKKKKLFGKSDKCSLTHTSSTAITSKMAFMEAAIPNLYTTT